MSKCISTIQDIALGKIFPVNILWLTPILLKEYVGNTPSNSPSLTWKTCVFLRVRFLRKLKKLKFHILVRITLFIFLCSKHQISGNCKRHENMQIVVIIVQDYLYQICSSEHTLFVHFHFDPFFVAIEKI